MVSIIHDRHQCADLVIEDCYNCFFLSDPHQALNQRNSDSVLNYGPKFEAQFEAFLSLYGFEERASTFVASGKVRT
jgi:hypothetical protein